MVYFIADMHIGHDNIIRLCGRPFRTVEDMDATIINNWNSRVKDEDTVYILGDIAFKSVSDPVQILKKLKGHKILIKGNHDGRNMKNPAFRACFDRIDNLSTEPINGERVVVCHYPIMEWDGYFRGAWHVYGHVHNNTTNKCFQYILNEPNMLNAGVDITGFRPVTLDELKVLNAEFKAQYLK